MKTRRSGRLAKTVKTAVLIGGPLLLAESDLHAAIVYVGTPQTFTASQAWTFNSGGIAFNEHMVTTGSRLLGSWQAPYFSFAKTGSNALALSPGATVGNSLNFGDLARFAPTSGNTFYGFRITSGGTHYGWAQISTSNSPGLSLTVQQFAFESTTNTPITVPGAVPEPTDFAAGLGALAMGAAAVIRRRQKEKAAQAA